jgi:hypothetical protein
MLGMVIAEDEENVRLSGCRGAGRHEQEREGGEQAGTQAVENEKHQRLSNGHANWRKPPALSRTTAV